MNRIKGNKRGISLAEVLIGMFVIVVGISGIVSTLWWAGRKQDSGKLMSEATNQARVIFETIIEESMIPAAAGASGSGTWPDGTYGLVDGDPNDRTAILAAPFDALTEFQDQATGQSGVSGQDETSSANTRFTRNVTVVRQVGTLAGVDDYLDGLALVTVNVYWVEHGLERKVTLEGMVSHNVN